MTFDIARMGRRRTWHSYLKADADNVHGGKVYVFSRPRGDRQVQYYRSASLLLRFCLVSLRGFIRIPLMGTDKNAFRREHLPMRYQ